MDPQTLAALGNAGANLIGPVFGSSSSGSQTSQTNISDEGIQELIRGILSGPGGVQTIGGSARRAGLYDDTSTDLVMGNLFATAANQAELARAPTVVQSSMKAPGLINTVICTALMEIGLLDKQLYQASGAYNEQLNPLTRIGYRWWADAVADKIRERNKVAILCSWAIADSRTKLLASKMRMRDYFRYPLGALTVVIGQPLCWCIGWAVAKFELDFA